MSGSPTPTKRKVVDAKSPRITQTKSPKGTPAASPRVTKSPRASLSKSPKPAAKKKETIEKVNWLWPTLSLLCMTVVPLAVYWSWYSVECPDTTLPPLPDDQKHDEPVCVRGAMFLPSQWSVSAAARWWQLLWSSIVSKAMPEWKHWAVYLVWNLWQALLFHYAPGPEGKGSPLADGTQLIYKYNGQFAWGVTLFGVLLLQYLNFYGFDLRFLANEFAPMLTVCLVFTSVVVGLIYIYARIFNCGERMTNSVIYDYFMGAILNPRIGTFDIKFFFELRPGIMHWYFTTLSFALLQYDKAQGSISFAMGLVCFYHLCFVNACYKGEACVPHSMDIIYEKFGWMLCMLDLVMVPFIFPMQAYYLYHFGGAEAKSPWSTEINLLLLFLHCLGYFIFDTANSQKDYFRAPGDDSKTGFPRMPWGKLENPKYIDAVKRDGKKSKLLCDGWWAYARHMNYTGDILMSWVWGITCGFGSYFPYTYTTYLSPLLLHRERRDDRDCHEKYGKYWELYKKRVPYRLVPYIY